MPRDIIAFFCDDIRAERSSTETVVGIYPDNVEVDKIPAMFPRMSIYLRINVFLDKEYEDILIYMLLSDEQKVDLTTIKAELISSAQKQATEQGSPFAGLVSRIKQSPFVAANPGRIQIVAAVNGDDYVCGLLNIKHKV